MAVTNFDRKETVKLPINTYLRGYILESFDVIVTPEIAKQFTYLKHLQIKLHSLIENYHIQILMGYKWQRALRPINTFRGNEDGLWGIESDLGCSIIAPRPIEPTIMI